MLKLAIRVISILIPAVFYIAGVVIAIVEMIKRRSFSAIFERSLNRNTIFDSYIAACILFTFFVLFFGVAIIIVWAWS